MRLRTVGIAFSVVAVLGVLGLMCDRVAARGRFAATYSTLGAGPDGTRALFLLADAIGARPTRLAEDFARLPQTGMLVAFGGCDTLFAREPTSIEQHLLDEWVKRGGTLVVAGASDYLPDDLHINLHYNDACGDEGPIARALARGLARTSRHDGGVDPDDEPDAGVKEGVVGPSGSGDEPPDDDDDPGPNDDDGSQNELPGDQQPLDLGQMLGPLGEAHGPRVVEATPASELFAGLGGVRFVEPARLRVGEKASAQTLLDGEGAPLAIAVTRGRGHIIVFAGASPFQNRNVRAEAGAALFGRLVAAYAPHGPVVFDEFHLGVGEQRSVMRYVGELGAGAVIAQIAIAVAFFLWRRGARFGPPRRAAPAAPAGTASYVYAVGTLYEKAADARGTLATVARHALGRIASYFRVPPSSAPVLAETLERAGHPDAAAAVRAVDAEANSVMSGELVARAKSIDDAVSRVVRSTEEDR